MSLIDAALQSGLREMENLQADPETGAAPRVTFGGYTWPCSRNTLKEGGTWDLPGGKMVSYDFAVRIRKDAEDTSGAKVFSAITQPRNGNTCTIDDRNYRIEFVDKAHAAFVTLLLTFDGK